jgi:hypothetical protein
LEEEEASSANPGWAGVLQYDNTAIVMNTLNNNFFRSCIIFTSQWQNGFSKAPLDKNWC